jgi:hypothetical protein
MKLVIDIGPSTMHDTGWSATGTLHPDSYPTRAKVGLSSVNGSTREVDPLPLIESVARQLAVEAVLPEFAEAIERMQTDHGDVG